MIKPIIFKMMVISLLSVGRQANGEDHCVAHSATIPLGSCKAGPLKRQREIA